MTQRPDPDRLLPSEALIGFVSWLTTRRAPVTMSEQHDSALPAQLVRDWIDVNNLRQPRDDFGGVDVYQPEYPEGEPHPTNTVETVREQIGDGADGS